jgi:prepilin-type N-terminal cleavage/methylation domain-containing protein/prepilin-type processing-associated H-X9-DG protein
VDFENGGNRESRRLQIMKEKEMKKKGFTLVELLVVIAIIALLMGILMPALARVRQIAYRLYCGTNLSGIGKAMLIYSNDYDDELPRAGVSGGSWVQQITFGATTPAQAYPNGNASITSCFYLLVKYSEVTPKSFLCKGDAGVTEFSPADPAYNMGDRDLVTLYDFGSIGQRHCSYAYHNPFQVAGTTGTGYGMTSSSDPGMAVAADPNPWQNCTEIQARTPFNAYVYNGSRDQIKKGNAQTHQDDGQNVLFVDGHTQFEKESNCGVDNDNIYTPWGAQVPNEQQRQQGNIPQNPGVTQPLGRNDSLLMTDGGGGTQR